MKLEIHGNESFTGVIDDNKGVAVYVRKTAGDQFEIRGCRLVHFDVISRVSADSESELNKRLDAVIKDYIAQFEAIIPKAVLDMLEDVFNDDDACIEAWLNKPKRPLGGATPRALLRTKDGVDTVIGMLERMKTGDFS